MSELKIFIATDNHLGYLEKDPLRGNDSFNTFEEILKMAKGCDFLLLGGDLYHENKPSRTTMYRSLNLFRKYCTGNGPIEFTILSDQSVNFPNYGIVNYENPNMNIELPVFSIHGNHDDPSREGCMRALSALDILSVANLINYFGTTQVDNVVVYPLLIRKGESKVAIYGLGNMKDERLNRMFAKKQVTFRRPAEYQDEWFNILVIHQNRENKGRGAKNCIHESFIPDFIDFVLWGHEHECLAELTESVHGNFYITQPGSSVATSLIQGEAKEKKVGVLQVQGQNFKWSTKKLKTVRPFIMEDIRLADLEHLDPEDPKIAQQIHDTLTQRVLQIIEEAKAEHEDEQTPSLVLIRLRVEHTGFPLINPQRFGAQFVGKMANPDNIVTFHRQKAQKVLTVKDRQRDNTTSNMQDVPGLCLEDLVADRLENAEKKLMLIPETSLHNALSDFVNKNLSLSLAQVTSEILEETQRTLKRNNQLDSAQDIHQVIEQTTEQARQESDGKKKERPAPKPLKSGKKVRTSKDDAEFAKSALQEERDEVAYRYDDESDDSPTNINSNSNLSGLQQNSSARKENEYYASSKTGKNVSMDIPTSESENDETMESKITNVRPRKQPRRATQRLTNYVDMTGDDIEDNDSSSPSPTPVKRKINRQKKNLSNTPSTASSQRASKRKLPASLTQSSMRGNAQRPKRTALTGSQLMKDWGPARDS